MEKNIRVLHISRTNFGGAGAAAFRLHLGLKSIEVQSKMLLANRRFSDADIVQLPPHSNILGQNSKYTGEKYIFRDDRSFYKIDEHGLVKEADILHLHWIAGMLNYPEFFLNIGTKPIVWTLHDMYPFTGGCDYAENCRKYISGCSSCHLLGIKNPEDLSGKIFERRKKAYEGRSMHIVTPSRWLAGCAKKSRLFKNFHIETIPNSVPLSVFTRRNKEYSRKLLKLPQDKILILFGASYNVERKGLKYLIEALSLLKDVDKANIALVVFGDHRGKSFKHTGFPAYRLGYIKDEISLSYAYSAADIFVMPSTVDNFPNTVLESSACETPVVAFNSGGIPEMIEDGKTGLLASTKDTEDLCRKIDWLVSHPEKRQQMGAKARRSIERKFTPENQARGYLKLYERIIKNNP